MTGQPRDEQRVMAVLAYHGAGFHGWQIQPEHRTVQGELRHICRKLLDLPIDWARNQDLRSPDGRRLEDWLDRSFQGRQFGFSRSYWPAYGGGLEGTRLQGEASRPNEPAWSRSLLGIGNSQYNMHPVTDGRRVFVNTGTVVGVAVGT